MRFDGVLSVVEKEHGISAVKSFAITFIQSDSKGGRERGGGKQEEEGRGGARGLVGLLQMSLARSR